MVADAYGNGWFTLLDPPRINANTTCSLSMRSIMIAAAFGFVNFSSVSVRAFNPTLFEKYKGIGTQEITNIIGVGQVCDLVGILICTLLTEFVGRKPLVIFGFLGAGIGTFVIPFTAKATILAAAVGLQQLTQAWVWIGMMVRFCCTFVRSSVEPRLCTN